MSDSLAIAAVTASLADLLALALPAVAPGARVTTLAPGSASLADGDPIVNIRLIAAESLFPDRASAPGGPLPPLGVQLTYLVSFHGDDTRQEPQVLMGTVLGTLYAYPVLTPALIASAIAGRPWLTGCALASFGEPIRLALMPIDTAPIAGLAAALVAPGLLGLVYQVGPVPLF